MKLITVKRPLVLPILQCAAWILVLMVGLLRQQKWAHHAVERIGHRQEAVSLSPQGVPSGANSARFLLGIFTTADDFEARQTIRRTLKSFNDTRVCSFGSVNKIMAPRPRESCKLIYTFVIGANPVGTKQIVNNGRKDLLTLPPRTIKTAKEANDITYLNIQENTHEGKTPTWFHYAFEVMHACDLDYAIKSDSTTNLLVDKFFQISETNLHRGGALVYSGKLAWSHTNNHIYMVGQFYLLSRPLAYLVSTIPLRSHKGVLYAEDVDAGLIVSQSSELLHVLALHNMNGMFPWRLYNETKNGEG